MKAESTTRPTVLFEIEKNNNIATIRFFKNIQKEVVDEAELTEKFVYDTYILQVPDREGLEKNIETNYDDWLQLAIQKENEPKPETEKEKVIRLEKENKQLGVEVSEREINEIMLGIQLSDLEIQVIELRGE